MMNASMYMTPYQWMTSGPSLRATGFRLGYVSTRGVTRASIAEPRERVVGHALGRRKTSSEYGDVSDRGVPSGTVDPVAACTGSGGVRR